MKVKLFWVNAPSHSKGFVATHNSGNAVDFEARINAWLAEHPSIAIEHISQSASGGSLSPSLWLVSVWYRENTGQGAC